MRRPVFPGLFSAVSRIALVSLIGSAAAACSTDTLRFAESPFSNPFASSERVGREPETTASTQASAAVQAAPTGPIRAQALPPVQIRPQAVRQASASAPAP